MEEVRVEERGIFTTLKIIGLQRFDSALLDELLEILQEEEKDEQSFVWVVRIIAEEKFSWNQTELAKESDFYGELFQTVKSFTEIEEAIAPLYKHPGARKYLAPLSESDVQEIATDAEALLMKKLLKQ